MCNPSLIRKAQQKQVDLKLVQMHCQIVATWSLCSGKNLFGPPERLRLVPGYGLWVDLGML
jgi:hypothetical protein